MTDSDLTDSESFECCDDESSIFELLLDDSSEILELLSFEFMSSAPTGTAGRKSAH